MKLADIQFREDLPFFLNIRGMTGRGVELGVQRGEFSRHLLQHWKGEKLYLIDSWREIPGYQDIATRDHNGHLDDLAHTFMAVYSYGQRATIIREFSAEAAEFFEEASLDFVYLDADHSFRAVESDLARWAPKIRPGGVLCGHDYMDGSLAQTRLADFGVKRAVDEWCGRAGKTLHTTDRKEQFPSWFVEL
jgi:hypothetical protein